MFASERPKGKPTETELNALPNPRLSDLVMFQLIAKAGGIHQLNTILTNPQKFPEEVSKLGITSDTLQPLRMICIPILMNYLFNLLLEENIEDIKDMLEHNPELLFAHPEIQHVANLKIEGSFYQNCIQTQNNELLNLMKIYAERIGPNKFKARQQFLELSFHVNTDAYNLDSLIDVIKLENVNEPIRLETQTVIAEFIKKLSQTMTFRQKYIENIHLLVNVLDTYSNLGATLNIKQLAILWYELVFPLSKLIPHSLLQVTPYIPDYTKSIQNLPSARAVAGMKDKLHNYIKLNATAAEQYGIWLLKPVKNTVVLSHLKPSRLRDRSQPITEVTTLRQAMPLPPTSQMKPIIFKATTAIQSGRLFTNKYIVKEDEVIDTSSNQNAKCCCTIQ